MDDITLKGETTWNILKKNSKILIAAMKWPLPVAEKLAKDGCAVTLCTNAAMAGETLQLYTRNHYVGRLHKLGVAIRTHARLFGADGDTVYFQDTLSDEAILLEEIDTLILSLGHLAEDSLETELAALEVPTVAVGDCVVPRTAEEAVYEGLEAGWRI